MQNTLVIILSLFCLSCLKSKLKVVTNLPNAIKESSGLAYDKTTDLFWTLEDANNSAKLYAFTKEGKLKQEVVIANAKNNDWEDILIDPLGNIYIGDFGNNNEKRKKYYIYKISSADLQKENVTATAIEFKLDGKREKDFEAFILKDNFFYLFSKEKDETKVYKVPNEIGEHRAEKWAEFDFEGKGNHKITSAALSTDGNMILLLNSSKMWVLTDFSKAHFFKGKIEAITFDHTSQKEGICILSNSDIFITDEKKSSSGGNLYHFNLQQ